MKESKTIYKIRIKKGDTVVVRTGKFKGKTGTVIATHPADNKITIEGINVVKKAIKPSTNNKYPQGGIIEITKPMWVSKVAILEPTSKKPSKIGYSIAKDGTKSRVYKKSGKAVK